MRTFIAICLAAMTLASPRSAAAQGAVYGSVGAEISPGHDANLLAAADTDAPAQSDIVLRFGPVAEIGYRSEPFRLGIRYEALAERFRTHPILNKRMGRQDGTIDLAFKPVRPVTIGLAGSFIDTHSPLELATGTVVTLGRVHARRLNAVPSLTWNASPVTTVIVSYDFTRESLAQQGSTVIHIPQLRVERKSRRASFGVNYRTRAFGPPGSLYEVAHIASVGVRGAARFAELEVEGGPRIFNDDLRPEIAATLRLHHRRAQVAIGFAETEATVLGETGMMAVRRLRLESTFQLSRNISLAAAPAWIRDSRDDRYATIRGVESALTARLSRNLLLTVSGETGVQEGTLSGTFKRIPYQRLETSLTFAYPGAGDPRNRRPRPGRPGQDPRQPQD